MQMCNFFSCIALGDGTVWFTEDDSHETVIQRLHPKQEYIRLEYSGEKIEIDEKTIPEWFERLSSKIEQRVQQLYTLIQPARADYEKIRQAARADYLKITQAAWAEYLKIKQAARAGYEKIEQPAWADYVKIKQAARADYLNVLLKIDGYVASSVV